MLLGAVLPLLGEAAVASGAPALATRAAAGVATGAAFSKMSMPAAMAAREAQYQMRSATEQPEAAPVPNAGLDQLLSNNDLSPFPNIQRAMQEPGGRNILQHAFSSVGPQGLSGASPEAPQAPVAPQSLLTPEGPSAGQVGSPG